jgi:hypothetical protein
MTEPSQSCDLADKEKTLIFSRSMQSALDNQSGWIETIRSDLEDIRSRLVVAETAMEMRANEGENNATEGDTSRGSHRLRKRFRSK